MKNDLSAATLTTVSLEGVILRVAIFILPMLFLSVSTGSAATVNYNDNCEGQIPTNQGQRWFGACPDPDNDETNWEDNILPQPGDDAVLGAEFGSVEVDGSELEAKVASVQAAGGLRLIFSSQGLTVTSGISNITGLVLTNNADIVAEAGTTVNLLGSTQLSANVRGPGIFNSSGMLNLNHLDLRAGATLKNNGTATLTGTFMGLSDGNTTFTNKSAFNVSGTGCQMRGEQSTFENDGNMSYSGSGNPFTVAPSYIHTSQLRVLAGTMLIESLTTNFAAGTLEISSGAILKLGPSPYSGTQSHSFSGLCCLEGDGLLDIFNNYSIESEINLGLGSGTPDSGVGGTRLQSTLDIGSSAIFQSGRFRFNGGTIAGAAGLFVNESGAWVYTRGTGTGTIDAEFFNQGDVQLGGGGLVVNAPFSNEENFTIVAGSVSGSGRIHNTGKFRMAASNPDNVSVISCTFFNQPDCTVEVISGHLRFSGTVENVPFPGLLTSGTWRSLSPATLTFPNQITNLGGGKIIGRKAAFPNVDPNLISAGGTLESSDWQRVGDLFLDGGSVKANDGSPNRNGTGGPGITIVGTLSIGEGGQALVAVGSQITSDQIQNGIEAPGANPAELAGVAGTGTATVVTPLLVNRGQIVPGGHDAVGTLQLVGDLVQQTDGKLLIDLDGLLAGSEFDEFAIVGDASLAGSVIVTNRPEFTPEVGQQFTILTTTGTITGAFEGAVSTNQYTYTLIHNVDNVVLLVDSVDGIPQPSSDPVAGLSLSAPHPNPFDLQTQLRFSLPCAGTVRISILDASGREVALLFDGWQPAGVGSVTWDGQDRSGHRLASGVFLLRLTSCGGSWVQKMTLAR